MSTAEGDYSDFTSPVIELIRWNKNEEFKASIQSMKPSDSFEGIQISLLHFTAAYNNYELTKHLIEMEYNINAETESKTTPLMVAIMFDSFKTAELLMKANANIYAINTLGKTALEFLPGKVLDPGVPEHLIRCIIESMKQDVLNHKTITDVFSSAKNLFQMAASKSSDLKNTILNYYVSEFSKSEMKIDISEPKVISFLWATKLWQCYEDLTCLPLISVFLEKVIDWNSLREKDLECFEQFFRKGSKQMVELFLQCKINDCLKNKFPGQDLVINIFGNRNVNARKLLKRLTFDIHSRNSYGSTALHLSLRGADIVASVKTLLNLGADANCKDNGGTVPLSLVYESNCFANEIVELLLLAGANPQFDSSWDEDDEDSLYFNYSSNKQELLIAQLVIDESLNEPIKETIIYEINNHARLKNIREVCSQQLENLKAVKVCGSITLYSVLITDPMKMADYIRDWEALEAVVLSSDIKQWHSYYVLKLKNSVNQTLHIIDLKIKASSFICETTGWPSSQYIVIEKIIRFLTYKDLCVFDKLIFEK